MVIVVSFPIKDAAIILVVGDPAGALSWQVFPGQRPTVLRFERLLLVAEMLEDLQGSLPIAGIDV